MSAAIRRWLRPPAGRRRRRAARGQLDAGGRSAGRAADWRRIYASLYVAPSATTGKGLFTPGRIRARAKLGEYEGEVIGLAEARRRARGRKVIAIVELERHALDGSGWRHGFRFMNHSCAPNCYIRCTSVRVEFYALRDIRAGEELTCDYGETQHEGSLRCRCGADRCRGYL